MSTVREQIITAAVAALNTGTPGGVPATERERVAAVEEQDGAGAIALYPVRDVPEEVGGGGGPLMRCRLTLAVEVWAKGTALLRPSQAVDPMLVWIVKTLAGNRLGGLAHDIVEGETIFAYEAGDNPWCRATVELIVSYQHLVSDAEARI